MIIMFLLISFFVFILLVVLLILLFGNMKNKQNRNKITNNLKIHFKLSILKHLYAEFDYETKNNNTSNT